MIIRKTWHDGVVSHFNSNLQPFESFATFVINQNSGDGKCKYSIDASDSLVTFEWMEQFHRKITFELCSTTSA